MRRSDSKRHAHTIVQAVTRSLVIGAAILMMALAGLAFERTGSSTPAASHPQLQQIGSEKSPDKGKKPDDDAKPDKDKKCDKDSDKDKSKSKESDKDKDKKCRPPSGKGDDDGHGKPKGD